MEQIELHWNDILDLKELVSHENELKGKSGIYVWGWLDEEKSFVPYYVGKADNLGQRLFEHLGKLKGGMYSIYSWQYAFSKNFKCLRELEKGKLIYVPSTIENWQNLFFAREVQDSLTCLIKNLKFSWGIADKKYNMDLERLIYNLFNSKNPNTKNKVGASVKGKWRADIDVKFSGDETLVQMCKANN
ncbi:MAG: GIY-YIG nuclease family protein [Ginsengibacter sp.]